jgi:hypothetical protein
MELEKFIKNLQMGEDRTRVINAEGEVIAEHFDDYRGTSVDWISATWEKKTRNGTKVGAIQPRHL